jgi:hypothetical protein
MVVFQKILGKGPKTDALKTSHTQLEDEITSKKNRIRAKVRVRLYYIAKMAPPCILHAGT